MTACVPSPPLLAPAQSPLRPRTAYLMAAAAGLLLPFSFAPYEWWWFAPAALIVLYQSVQRLTPRQGAIAGWLFGLGYFGIGVHWIYFSLHLFGAAIAPLAALLTLVFVLVMTVFPAATCWVWLRLRRGAHPLQGALLFAAIWVLAELLRGKLMGGFPWILAGYSQTSGPLGSLAPWVGVYGISFLLVLASLLLLCVSIDHRRTRIGALLGLVGIVSVTVGSRFHETAEPTGEPIGIRLVQANIAQEMKFSTERLNHSLSLYTSMSASQPLSGIDLLVWPETAIPTYFDRVDDVLQPFVASMDARGVSVLSGGFYRENDQVFNSVRELGGDRALYRKRHLVPFGEFMPLRFVLDFAARFIDIPMSDLSAGSGPHVPLRVAGADIGVSICYEDVYGEELRALLPAAGLLVNVSNDAWFGDTAAPHQHEQKARMRARELARPLVRVTNTGVSSSIGIHGEVTGRIRHDQSGILDVNVQPMRGKTPYASTGNWPVGVLALAIVGWAFAQRRQPAVLS